MFSNGSIFTAFLYVVWIHFVSCCGHRYQICTPSRAPFIFSNGPLLFVVEVCNKVKLHPLPHDIKSILNNVLCNFCVLLYGCFVTWPNLTFLECFILFFILFREIGQKEVYFILISECQTVSWNVILYPLGKKRARQKDIMS